MLENGYTDSPVFFSNLPQSNSVGGDRFDQTNMIGNTDDAKGNSMAKRISVVPKVSSNELVLLQTNKENPLASNSQGQMLPFEP